MYWIFAYAVISGFTSITRGERESPEVCKRDLGAEAGRRFALELYNQIAKVSSPEDNIFVAPTTVASSLAMILAGAMGNTRGQIWDGMMLPNISEQFTEDDLPCLLRTNRDALAEESIEQKKKGSTVTFNNPLVLRTASKLYGEVSYDFDQDFIDQSEKYGAKMEEVDFRWSAEAERQSINNWTSEATDGKIQEIFAQGDINADTKLAIVSAVYFKGSWKMPFDHLATRKDDFTTAANKAVRADFMSENNLFRTTYSSDLNAKLIELPYLDDAYERYSVSMIIVLPAEESSMTDLHLELEEAYLSRAISHLLKTRPQRTILILPKFKMARDYKLQPILENIGITDMFSPANADLSAMRANSSADQRRLFVSSAVHKTFVEVDERGTEAAGVTGITLVPMSLPPIFNCDKPFLTIIYEKKSDSILFIGRVSDPTKE